MAPRRRAGVTYVEAIVVLGIIAFVVAVLFPMFQHEPREYRTACRSNLKQLGLALTQYAQDSDGALPSGVNAAGNGWAGQLYPFTRNIWVYRCPNDPHDGPYISYAANRNLARQKVSALPAPAGTVALYEFSTLGCDPSVPEAVSATGLSALPDSDRHNAQTHGLCFAFVDGHVRFMKPGQVSGGPDAVRPQRLKAYEGTFAAR